MKLAKLTLFYDNWCSNCTKFSKVIVKLDWLKLLDVKQLRNEQHLELFKDINLELAKKQMASFGTKWHYGYDSIYFTLSRLPLFWLLIPLMMILKITKIGLFIYKEFALKRKIIPLYCEHSNCIVPELNSK